MDDYIWWTFNLARLVAGKVVVSREGIEDLAGIGQVGLEGEDAGFWVRKVDQIEVQNLY